MSVSVEIWYQNYGRYNWQYLSRKPDLSGLVRKVKNRTAILKYRKIPYLTAPK